MKKLLLLIPLVVGLGSSARASTCVQGALSLYDAPSFTCSLGDLTFSDFSYTTAADGGAVAPSDAGVTVKPITSGFGSEFGLEFVAPWLTSSGQLIDSSIAYDVTSTNPDGITDLELYVVGSATGDGAASVAEGAPTPPVILGTSFSSTSNINTATTTFPPADVFSLSLTKDIGLSGGTSGLAHVSDVFNLFSETTTTTTTPEPSLIILCAGMVGLVPVARRKFLR